MHLGIDASNLRAGGGVTHLVELLRAADPHTQGISQVTVWGGKALLSRIEHRPWLVKNWPPMLDRSLPYRAFWQRFKLSRLARLAGCDVLFVPGGAYAGDFQPVVTMSQNMLPFEWGELRRYGFSWIGLRLMFLRWTQSRSFRQAAGLIFLTQYARDEVMRVVKTTAGKTALVPHGIDDRFVRPPRAQFAISRYSLERPFRILYVSIVDVYKHQWYVAEAIAKLRKSGLPVALSLVGPAYPPALRRLKAALARLDPAGAFLRYLGPVTHDDLPRFYGEADAFLYASSCENMPIILMEAMASGLPIACSNRGPMPEVLGDAGAYFDPEQPESIADALRTFVSSPQLRAMLAKSSFERAQCFSWRLCADKTVGFLAEVAGGGPPTVHITP